MREYTPDNSFYEEDMEGDYGGDDGDETREDSRTRVVLRVANSVLHTAICALLVSVMGTFMRDEDRVWVEEVRSAYGTAAVVLLVFTSLDILLDAGFLILPRRKWPAWALLLRLMLAIGYLAVFMAYVGLGSAFSEGFTSWGMDSDYAGPVANLLLWVLGVWGLVHTAIHRRRLGNGTAKYVAWATRGRVTAPQRRRRSDLWTRRRAVRRERAARKADLEREGNQRTPQRDEDAISLQLRVVEGDKTNSVSSASTRPTTTTDAGKGAEAIRPPPAAQIIS